MKNPLVNNYIHYLQNGKNILFRVDIHIIGGCNFRCVMCDNWQKKTEMIFDHKDILKLILSLKQHYQCNYIRFHGQEPSLYPKLEELILFAKKLGIKVAIKTNGWLITDKRLLRMVQWGLDELYLSIDWPNPRIHDAIRWIPGSFVKNQDLIIKGKFLNPNLKIYINSVVMKSNFAHLVEMMDFGKHHNLDRVSFVFLNDKNRKDIADINLSKEEFLDFFQSEVIAIYRKSETYGIPVDFSPFLSNLVWRTPSYIIKELEENFDSYIPEILDFYQWEYGKHFYDSYGCSWPIDHASINFNGDMFGCCVVERDSEYSVGNILDTDVTKLWGSEKYEQYRNSSDSTCSYAHKCASNFYSRKSLFKDIYLNDTLYPKTTPVHYYRYLRELHMEPREIQDTIKVKKFRSILLYFYHNLKFYRDLLENLWIYEADIANITSLDFIKRLPILTKKILQDNYQEIEALSIWHEKLRWNTSGSSGNSLKFFYPLDFKRYIRQIAIFSHEFSFTYQDSYFYLTPINCNQMMVNDIDEPEYVRKIYVPPALKYDFDKKYFQDIHRIFSENTNTRYLHADAKHLLYLILGFQKYDLNLPVLDGISLSYTYTNARLRDFIATSFWCKVADNYGCSEVGPIAIDTIRKRELFWDNLYIESLEGYTHISDFDNPFFPFLRYQNGDIGTTEQNSMNILGKNDQVLSGKNMKEIDEFFNENFPEIITYQFLEKEFLYISSSPIQEDILVEKLQIFLSSHFTIRRVGDIDFFILGHCSKFKTIA